MASKTKLLFVFSSFLIHLAFAIPEPGVKEMVFDKAKEIKSFAKSLFKDAEITISGQIVGNNDADGVSRDYPLSLRWYLLESDCARYFLQVDDNVLRFLTNQAPTKQQMHKKYKNGTITFKSGHLPKETITLRRPISAEGEIPNTEQVKTQSSKQDDNPEAKAAVSTTTAKKQVTKTNNKNGEKPPAETASESKPPKNEPHPKRKPKTKSREKRAVPENEPDSKPQTAGSKEQAKKNDSKPQTAGSKGQANEPNSKPKTAGSKDAAEKTNSESETPGSKEASTSEPTEAGIDGNYLLVISLEEELPEDAKVQVKVSIKMSTGYLSASEWPLLPFYGAMSLVYLAYGVVWLIVSACQWRELLRIQFWIGGVIALGMLEKAILFSEYNNVNDTGKSTHGLVVLALVLSCIKRTLSRILIIIVSMGFGIVKPRLGGALHRVLGVGCLYFILCVIEGSYREFSVKADVNRKQLIASVPLSVLDAVICWWIFMSLLQTMRTLRIRKNLVKLSLYRHFTNILVVSVIASVAFMVWVIKAHSFSSCIKDWKEIWIDDAFWHFLFALILLAIMVLWRPTANNQRYAFTPLIDVGEDDEDDMTLSDAFHGMKMRSKGDVEAPSRAEKQRKKAEDDLKWVEENIPTSGGIDTALPSLLDSDEEMMTTKLEMNKME